MKLKVTELEKQSATKNYFELQLYIVYIVYCIRMKESQGHFVVCHMVITAISFPKLHVDKES